MLLMKNKSINFKQIFLSKFNSLIGPTLNIFKFNKKLYSDTMEPSQVSQAKKEQEVHFVKDESDPLKDKYGVLELIQSKTNPEHRHEMQWNTVCKLGPEQEGQTVNLRVRLQKSRIKGKGGFLVLREGFYTIQGCLFVKENAVSEGMIKFAEKIHPESLVDVQGVVKKAMKPIESCTQSLIELDIVSIFLVASAQSPLPFQMDDATRKLKEGEEEEADKEAEKVEVKVEIQVESNNISTGTEEKKENKEGKKKKEKKEKKEAAAKEEKKAIVVNTKTRLDNRVLDLRVGATQAVMKIQSAVGQLFREFVYQRGFVEIHSPKLIAGSSEGGSNVFKLKYFEQDACLAQSPQLYKQMAIIGDMKKVFEVGPVFRAENANTPRHLCEFQGLDIEMEIKEHYFEVLDVIHDLFYYIFEGLNQRHAFELNIIANQYPFELIKMTKESVRLDFREGCELLKAHGVEQDVNQDLDTVNEALLGKIVKEKFGTDFYILYRYPKSARPFYTMPAPDDDNFTNSYDAFIRGEEVLSGAQRIHSYELLFNKVVDKGINPETLKDYLNAFKLGAPAHGGAGIGLERVVKLFIGYKNVKKCVMFPRDPKRLTP